MKAIRKDTYPTWTITTERESDGRFRSAPRRQTRCHRIERTFHGERLTERVCRLKFNRAVLRGVLLLLSQQLGVSQQKRLSLPLKPEFPMQSHRVKVPPQLSRHFAGLPERREEGHL